MRKFLRPVIGYLQSVLSKIFSKFGLILVWDQYSAISNFFECRYLVVNGFNGLAFFGKTYYFSKGIFLRHYRQTSRMQEFTSNIIDATGKKLLPISMIESALVKEGTFKIRKKLILKSERRTHQIGDDNGLEVLIPDSYSLFGHFVPQLLPFLIRENRWKHSINLVVPDDINRNFEIFQYFGIYPKEMANKFRPFRITRVAKQIGLYPAKEELNLIKSKHLENFQNSKVTFSSNNMRLYLTRAVAQDGRKVVNESEVLREIGQFGFTVIDPSTLAYAEAAELFANSEIVIGPYGSAFFHTLSMRRGSTIIEFSGNKFIRWHLKKMAVDTGLNHKLIINESLPNHDLIINVPILKQILMETISSLGPNRR